MATTQDKTTIIANQAPPIDLNALHTPHKLAAFVVNVPSLKHEYSFLFNEENKNNNNQQSQSFIQKGLNLNPHNTQFLNVNMSMSLIPSIIRKTKSKSAKKKRDKKKSKLPKKIKPPNKLTRLNPDEQDMIHNIYSDENDSVGPTSSANNLLPSSPGGPLSKTNIFNHRSSKKSKQKRPPQHSLTDLSPLSSSPTHGHGAGTQPSIKPSLPSNINNENNTNNPAAVSLAVLSNTQINSQINNINDSPLSHHHKSTLSTASLMSDNTGIPEPALLNLSDVIDDIPMPIEPVIPSRYDTTPSIGRIPSSEPFQYEISMMDPPIAAIDEVKLSEEIPTFPAGIDEQISADLSTDYDDEEEELLDNEIDSEEYEESSSEEEEELEDYYSHLEEEEENICIRIGKVLYENSWTGDMISSSTEFSRREYNALLDVDHIPTDSYISNLVWKIIFYSQKKTKDELIDEDKIHIKWYWWDSNDIQSDWKWRKYNVVVCQWITDQFEMYLKDNNHNCINFKKCQEKFEEDHEKNEQKNQKTMRNKPNMDDVNDDKQEEKKEYLSESDEDEKRNKKKKITIDAYFDKHNNYDHFLVIDKDENDALNLLIWHKITTKGNDGLEYYREIRLDHKLFGIKQDTIVHNYQPNPSPFAIPPQLAVDT